MQSPSSFAQAQTFQLAKPIIKVDSIFFQESATVSIEMNHPGSGIFFKVEDAQEINSIGKYSKPITVSSSNTISTNAYHPDFIKSETISIELKKVKQLPEKTKISITPKANDSYPGNGAISLTDLKKGSLQFRSGNWLGFQNDTVQIDFRFEQKEVISSIGISFLEDNGSWIFMPKAIEILVDNKVIKRENFLTPTPLQKGAYKFVDVDFTEQLTNEISIRILNLEGKPDWHAGKGLPSWIFIDEVFFPN